MPKSKKSIPTSAIARSAKLLTLGTKLLGQEIALRLSGNDKLDAAKQMASRLAQAKTLVASLSRLKGAAMKTGQILSLELSDLLPKEVTDVLRNLHDNATFLPINDINKILRRELGEAFSRLQSLSEEPIAAASIGQVHRAIVEGAEVAVKVQFPGVAKSINADLAIVKQVLQSLLWLQQRPISLDDLFAEVARVLRQETDYRKEAGYLCMFAQLLQDSPQYVVPRLYDELSTKRVLTMSYEHGVRISSWLNSEPSKQAREEFAEIILDLLFKEFFVWGIVQTDPNYGNFLYRPESKQLVLLDFGATDEYGKQTRRDVRNLLALVLNNDEAEALRLSEKLEYLNPKESPEVRALYIAMMRRIVSIFRPENQPFNFADTQYLQDMRQSALTFSQAVQYTAPAKKLIFLNRKLGGVFHLLKDLRVQVDLAKHWQQIMALKI